MSRSQEVRHHLAPAKRRRHSGIVVPRSPGDLVHALNRAMADNDVHLPPCQTARCRYIQMCAAAELACEAFASYCAGRAPGWRGRPNTRIPSATIFAKIFPGESVLDDCL